MARGTFLRLFPCLLTVYYQVIIHDMSVICLNISSDFLRLFAKCILQIVRRQPNCKTKEGKTENIQETMCPTIKDKYCQHFLPRVILQWKGWKMSYMPYPVDRNLWAQANFKRRSNKILRVFYKSPSDSPKQIQSLYFQWI